MRTVIMLFTRDLRVHDNPALALACDTADRVVPLFVRDPALRSSPVRDAFLQQSLADLSESLRKRGGDLLVRRGDPVAETVRAAREFGAIGVALSEDVSAYARARQRGIEREGLKVNAMPERLPALRLPLAAAPGHERHAGRVRATAVLARLLHQVLAAFPKLGSRAYRTGVVEQWRDDEEALQAWQSGNTGVAIVDAGMRQLLAEGWMHNRARTAGTCSGGYPANGSRRRPRGPSGSAGSRTGSGPRTGAPRAR